MQRQAKALRAPQRWPDARQTGRWTACSSAVHDFSATVLGVRRFVGARNRGFFLAEAHCLDLGIRHAQKAQRTTDGLRAALAQREVVLAATALVGVPFYRNAASAIGLQEARVRFDEV